MQLRYSYRLDPQPRHRVALGKAFGCARVVFNDALDAREAAHQAGKRYVTDREVSARLTAAKRTPERAWLGEVSSVVLQQALADLNTAYRNYFASLNGKRKGPKVAKPRFRSRKNRRQAIRFTANARFKVLANGKLRLPKIGDVPVRWSRPLPSEPSSVTVIKDAAGRYFASFVIEATPVALPATGSTVGIDLGLSHFAVLSDGQKIAAPKFLRRAEKMLKRRQRELSRKQKGSANRNKARVKVARFLGVSRTLLPTMSVPIPFPDPARGDDAVRSWWLRDGVRAAVAALAVAIGTVALGVLAGLGWAAVAPRPLLVMTSPGAAALVNTETSAFIAADAAFCLVCVAGGVVSGVLGYLFAVRRYGPLAMAGLIAGALGAAFVARWVGEQSGLATFQHLLATLPTGATFRDSLALGASGALAVWPLAAAVTAGGLELLLSPGRHRARRGASPGERSPETPRWP